MRDGGVETVGGKLAAELELTAILRSEQFRKSQRSCDFLRYVVEQVLAGRGAELKERTIGSAVFQKADDYDTAADAFVRVRANDVRKRLAQYYDANEPRHGVRIELRAGSYVPHFGWVEGTISVEPEIKPEEPLSPPLPPAMPFWQLAAPTAIALFLAIIAIRIDVGSQDAYSHFWAGLLAHRTAIRVSLGHNAATGQIPQDLANAALPFSEVAREWQIPLLFDEEQRGSQKGSDLKVNLRLIPEQKEARVEVDPDHSPDLRVTASSSDALHLAVDRLCSRKLFEAANITRVRE